MQDDIIGALTQEVKEEVIQNYLYERRLVDEQIDHVNELAAQTALLQDILYRRFARIYEFLSEKTFIDEFARVIGLNEAPFESRFRNDPDFRKGLRFIKVWGLTTKTKFARLLLEAYRRLVERHGAYKEAYENLEAECRAVNYNIKRFRNGFDLLLILNFLKDMDVDFIDKKHWLSDNFTPQEMSSVEANLSFKAFKMEQFKLLAPLDLPGPAAVRSKLKALADGVYSECASRIRSMMR